MSDISTNLCCYLSETILKTYIGQLLPIERLCYNSPSTDVLSTMSSSTVSDLWAHDRRFGCSPIGSNHLRGFSDVNPTEGVYLIEVYCTITLPRARKGHFSFQENHYLLHDLFFPCAGFQMFQPILTSATRSLYMYLVYLYLSVFLINNVMEMGTLPPIRQWTLVKRTFSSEPILCWSYRKYLPTSGAFTPSGGGKWYSRVKVDGTVTMYWFIGLLVYISAVLTYLLGTVSHALWPWATRLAEENDQHFLRFFSN